MKITVAKLLGTTKFPLYLHDKDGNITYYEDSNGRWIQYEFDSKGNRTYYENSYGYWNHHEYDSNGNMTYYENSDGYWEKCEYVQDSKLKSYYENSNGTKRSTSRATACENKEVEIDGIKYKLTKV